MKIAIIVRKYDKRGGISSYAAELAERFASDNEVHVFAASWQDVGNNKITFHKIPMLSFDFLKNRKKFAWNNVFEVWSFTFFSFFMVNSSNFDIVHSQGDFIGNLNVYTVHSCHKAWLALARAGKISVLEWLKKSFLNPLHFNVQWVERHSLKTAKKIIAISQGVKREIIQYYNLSENKIEVIPNGVDIKKFNPDNKLKYRTEIRNKYNLKDSDFVIIFPAHEFKRKGLTQIIEALNILKNKRIHLLVVGRDDKTPFAGLVDKYQLMDKIHFLGETTELEKYYAASDCFVFPTEYEPFGLVITEAMASGLPVIVSKSAGAAELIVNGKNGVILRDNSDLNELSGKIREIAESKIGSDNISNEARRTAEKYSWGIIAEKTLKFYSDGL